VESVGTLDLGGDQRSGIVRCRFRLGPQPGFAWIEPVCLALDRLSTGVRVRRIAGFKQVVLFIGCDRK
jgi:hypothetical protein